MIVFSKFFAIFLALLVITKTLFDYRRRQESFTTFLFWTATWLVIVYVAIYPNNFYKLAGNLSASENVGMGTFVGIAFIFLFFITYRIYIKASRLEQKIKEMVMKLGIKDIENDDSSNNSGL